MTDTVKTLAKKNFKRSVFRVKRHTFKSLSDALIWRRTGTGTFIMPDQSKKSGQQAESSGEDTPAEFQQNAEEPQGETRAASDRGVLRYIDDAMALFIRAAMGLIGMGFIYGLPVLALSGHELSCTNRYLLFGPFVLGALVTGYYFSSQISLSGKARLSPTTSLTLNAGGSVAFALVAAWYGKPIFVPQTCEVPKFYVHILDLPLTTHDETQYDIMHKHWPLNADERYNLAYGYEIELERKQNLKLRMKVTLPEGENPLFCVFNVNVETTPIDPKDPKDPDALVLVGDNYKSPYEIHYNKNNEPGHATVGLNGEHHNCFTWEEEGDEGGKLITGVELHPNGAKLIFYDQNKAAEIR